MPSLIELTASLVASHASNTQMTSEQLAEDINKVHASLKALVAGITIEPIAPEQPKLTIRQAFKKDEVICMICGKGGFKTLKRHLGQAHDLKPGQYRKQFNIPSTQSLAAKSYSESRRQMALDRNLGDGLAKAREKRAADKKVIPAVKVKDQVPSKAAKAPAPAVKVKAQVPMMKVKAPVIAKTAKAPKDTKSPSTKQK